MNEENPNQTEQNQWQAPPLPEQINTEDTTPQMSEAATLGNIFIEPGRTFQDLRRKPRFILATLIIIVLTTAFSFLFANKIGEEGFRRFAQEQVEKNPQAASLPPEQKQKTVELNMTIFSVIRYLLPVFIIFGLALGGLIYWLAIKATGGAANYWHAVSVYVYSSFAPGVVSMAANILILFLKSVDDIEIEAGQRGLIHANPGYFIDGKQSPVLATLLGTFDFFYIWGLILAAIGLQKVGKLSAASAWTIVLIIGLLGLTFRVISALFSGNAV